jgi:HK97 family phage major capsid protein
VNVIQSMKSRLRKAADSVSAFAFLLAIPAALAMAAFKDGGGSSDIDFPALKEARGKLGAKRKELSTIFDEAGPDIDLAKVKSIDGDTTAKAAHIKNLNDEMADLGKKVDELREVAKAAAAARSGEAPGENSDDLGDEDRHTTKGRQKSVGELIVKSDAFKTKGATSEIEIELKALFDSATGWVPETTRGPRLVDFATRPIELLDLIPTTTTNQTAVTFMEETTFTNAAAETAEGAAKPEATLALTERTSVVRKIPVFLSVTDETLEDEPRARQYIENRLPFMVRQRLSGQIIAGTGAGVNLRGILNVVGIQTQAKGADPTPDAVYKAMTKVEVTGQAIPDAVVFHPNDWQDVRLLRTADGIYIWGNPSEAGPERIWGLRVVKVQAATENTAVVGDWANFSELAVKKEMEVKISDSHASHFIENKQAIRAEMRAALIFYRPTAFCTVTGI